MNAQLILRPPDGEPHTRRLEGSRLSLGRSAENDLCFPDDSGLSRHHLIFEAVSGGWAVRDLGSKNGTYVNGARISGSHMLAAGDQIAAGHLVIEFTVEAAEPAEFMIETAETAPEAQPLSVAPPEGAGWEEISAVLHPPPPSFAGWEIAAWQAGCHELAGDLTGYLACPDGRLGVLAADVPGRGLRAVVLAHSLSAWARLLAAEHADAGEIVRRLNRALKGEVQETRFVRVVLCLLHSGGAVAYARAGHHPPLVVRAAGGPEELAAGGFPLGVFPLARYEQAQAQLASGDALVIYSDGVVDSEGQNGVFGIARLAQVLAAKPGARAGALAESVRTALTRWRGGAAPTDDCVLLVARKT
jgi:hypothetical protein